MAFRFSIVWLFIVAFGLLGAGIEYVTGLSYLNSLMVGTLLVVLGYFVSILIREM